MKRAHVVASLLVGALLCSGSALAQTPQVISVPISNPGEPITLEISILSAKIHVYGEDRDDVEFEVSVSDGRRQIITPSGPKPLAGAGYELEIDEEDNYISLDTDWRANNVRELKNVVERSVFRWHRLEEPIEEVIIDPFASISGPEWDHVVIPIDIPAGATWMTVQALSVNDETNNLPASFSWMAAAMSLPEPYCGDGYGNYEAGEYCDDGNLDEDDGCSSSCTEVYCGDGTTDGSEDHCGFLSVLGLAQDVGCDDPRIG